MPNRFSLVYQMKQTLIDELILDRNWRFSELEYVRKVPIMYTNTLFLKHIDKHWRMCVPLIYAHWEGFVIASYKQVVGFLSMQKYRYSQLQPHIILLANKHRFNYLQGQPSKEQKKRFLEEYTQEERNGLEISTKVVSAKSNLNFKQFSSIMDDFGISITDIHLRNRTIIDKLVNLRNKIAHGENSVIVHESDVDKMIFCIMEMIDVTICDINNYLATEAFLS